MPFSGIELLIVAVVALLFFGLRRFPALGRQAGEGIHDLGNFAREKLGDRVPDAGSIGRSAGAGVREARELKESILGDSPPERVEGELVRSERPSS